MFNQAEMEAHRDSQHKAAEVRKENVAEGTNSDRAKETDEYGLLGFPLVLSVDGRRHDGAQEEMEDVKGVEKELVFKCTECRGTQGHEEDTS